jgi:hypothetical protein
MRRRDTTAPILLDGLCDAGRRVTYELIDIAMGRSWARGARRAWGAGPGQKAKQRTRRRVGIGSPAQASGPCPCAKIA